MVMHARKPQRISDGYFEKHQPHYQSSKYNNSKREYDRDTQNRSNYRERESSPSAGGIGGSLNNGNTTYRSQSPEVDSPSRHDIRDRDRDRDRFSYIQKMRDRERDVYKKDKYSDKRERRNERDPEHRTNHDRLDRRTKLSGANAGDKRSGSDDRDRDRERDLRDGKRDRSERDRDRDRDRERDRDRDRNERDRDRDRERNERGERVARCGDWSEHVSSSGKMYYYNCKTEVSQWEKPKEWIEKERNLARDQHREKDYREKDRERDREERFNRTAAYSKHSNSRGNSRLRWPYENESGPPPLRRRIDENPDMDISPGDSTPTSEASYSITVTPNATQLNEQSAGIASSGAVGSQIPGGPVLLANALPRLASHPQNSTTLLSQVHYPNVGSATSSTGVNLQNNCHRSLDTVVQQSSLLPASSPNHLSSSQSSSVGGNHLLHHHVHLQMQQSSSLHVSTISVGGISDHHLNSNAAGPGPPKVGTKSLDSDSQKQNSLMRQQVPQGNLPSGTIDAAGINNDTNHNNSLGVADLRENALNSPLYNFSFSSHGLSPLNQSKNPLASTVGSSISTASASTFPCNTAYGLKTADGINTGNSVCSISSLSNVSAIASTSGTAVGSSSTSAGVTGVDGPPTPTQELDASGLTIDQRRLEGTSSASISNLQSCVVSTNAVRSQDPDLSPKLAKYFRGDLIAHYNNWPGYIIEKQIHKIPEEKHIYGDLQNSKISAELKCARSVLRITEIKSTIQMQKILYLREQVQQLEELKTQNSFMSNDL